MWSVGFLILSGLHIFFLKPQTPLCNTVTDLPVIRVLIFLLLFAGGLIGGRSLARNGREQPAVSTVSDSSNGQPLPVIASGLPRVSDKTAEEAEQKLKTAVERLAGSLTSDARFDEFLNAIRAWAAVNPEAALSFARANLNVARESQTMIALLTDWAHRDPQSAWAWASSKHPEEGRHIAAVLKEIGKSNPDTAWQFAGEYSQKYPQQAEYGYSCALHGILFAGEYEKAAQLINQVTLPAMPDGLDGKYVLGVTIVSDWAQYEPEKAAQWWLVNLPDDSVAKGRALINLTQNWAENDPEKAANFAVNLPSGAERDNALTEVLMEWLNQDSREAADWMNLYPAEPGLDNARAALIRNPDLVKKDPLLALSWANSITDEFVRENNLTSVIDGWLQRNPAAAMDYLQNSAELAPEMRDRIVTSLKDLKRFPTTP
jgi:hypothetical protein